MTWDVAFVLTILAIALVLFITEKLRMDVVALLVLGVLGVSGMVTTEEALAGFSNPAVVTVWAMFILSAGLSATGVADFIGQRVLRLAGTTEPRMILVIMLTAGVLSAIMNNIGVAALMLPVVMDVARRTSTPPSRLLMPMAYGSLLGGLTTLIGTPPNLVASTALRQTEINGEALPGFGLFEFAPIGGPALILGALFVAFVGRHLLPSRMPEGMELHAAGETAGLYRFAHSLEKRRFRLRIGDDSPLHDRMLRESNLASVLGVGVVSVTRRGDVSSDIGGDFVLRIGDILTVEGSVEDFRQFLDLQALEVASGNEILEILSYDKVGILRAAIAADSELAGLTVGESDFQRRFPGVRIVSIRRQNRIVREDIAQQRLEAGDVLTIDGRADALGDLLGSPAFDDAQMVSEEHLKDVYSKSDTLLQLQLPERSHLCGETLAAAGIAEDLHLRVLGIVRSASEPIYFPAGGERLQGGDRLLVHGRPQSLDVFSAIQSLQLVDDAPADEPPGGESREFTEVTLAPGSELAGKTLRELDFRQRYGLFVRSIWRRGRALRSHLRNIPLEFGDALLLSGPHERIEALTADRDFLVLSRTAYGEAPAGVPAKAILAALLMAAVVVPVLFGWLPIAIAAVAGGALMVATRCLSMEEAYRAIEWKSVFLIAGMIPLGTAMQTSGAAQWVAEGVSSVAAPYGPWGIMVSLYVLTAAATTIVPTTALVLIMAPIAIGTSVELGLDPKMLMMAVAMAASASFTSPISHPANVLVMGPGGYRFVDYIKLGVLLALVVMVTVLPLVALVYR